MFGYIYLVRNKINDKKYIGQKHSEVFDPNYYGSGVYLKRALSKYGVENFEHVKILEWCEDKKSLDNAERYWIDKYNAVEDPNFYNLAKGGIGTTAGSRRSDQWKKKISEITAKRKWKDESRQKISDYLSGRVWMTNGDHTYQASPEEIDKLISEGWKFGRGKDFLSKEARERLSQLHRGKCFESEESLQRRSEYMKGSGNPFYGKTHSDEQKSKWSKLRSEMVWVNKDGVNTTIHFSKLDEYLNQGYIKGMVRKKKSSTTIESITDKKDISE